MPGGGFSLSVRASREAGSPGLFALGWGGVLWGVRTRCSLTSAAPGPDGARPPALARGGMSKSKRNPLLVPTGNHSIMAGKKSAAHPKKVDKKHSKYRGAFRRGELE